MSKKKRNKFDFESEEKRRKYLDEVIRFFQTERDEEIGVVAAQQVLDFFLESMGEEIYKKALSDAQGLLRERFEDLEVELDLLLGK